MCRGRLSRSFLGGVLLLATCGCGPRLVPVEGRVTFNGKPFGHAMIVFTPKDANGHDASAPINEDGTFALVTARPITRAGAFPGKTTSCRTISRRDLKMSDSDQ